MKDFKIVIDVMGSDRGPEMMVHGASLALAAHENLSLILVGDEEIIRRECKVRGIDPERVEIYGTSEVITNYDSPAAALFEKKDSSLVRALTLARDRDDVVGVINAGNTGALLASSVKYLAREDRVRPALAAVLPTEDGSFACLVDTGATIDCNAATLLHFARLGSEFMHELYKLESPRVALLSNGAEKTKGNKVVKEAHELLAECADINFVGNVEGTNVLAGVCDVIVCDGFAGNQVLKVTEGTARRIITDIVKYSKIMGKPEYMELVAHLMATYDFNSLGGGIILGAKKTVIKAHGAANEKSIKNVADILLNLAENKQVFDGK